MKSLYFLAFVLVALVSGCGAPWTVVKQQRTPTAIAGARSFSVKPLDFSAVSIDGKSESAWRAAHGDAKSKWWDQDKAVASRHFMRMLTSNTKIGRTFTAAGEAGFDPDAPIVVLRVGDVDGPDFHLTVQVTTPSGDVIEEATMTLTIRGYGISEQLRGSGKRFADAVAEYIAKQSTASGALSAVPRMSSSK